MESVDDLLVYQEPAWVAGRFVDYIDNRLECIGNACGILTISLHSDDVYVAGLVRGRLGAAVLGRMRFLSGSRENEMVIAACTQRNLPNAMFFTSLLLEAWLVNDWTDRK